MMMCDYNPFAGGERRAGRRPKRSHSEDRYVEILVAADSKMVAYHGANLQHYILTLMSIVSFYYFSLQNIILDSPCSSLYP